MDPILGQIILWTCRRIPSGWLICDGSTLQITTYQALFSLLGVTYGGDGRTTFNLPDLRSRIPMGVDLGLGAAAALGVKVGVAMVNTMVTAQANINVGLNNLPSHTHAATFTAGGPVTANTSVEVDIPVVSSSTAAPVNVPGPTTVLGPSATNGKCYNTASPDTHLKPFTAAGTVTVPAGSGTVAVANAGGGLPIPLTIAAPLSISNIQPSLYLNYIIATQGIYPTFD